MILIFNHKGNQYNIKVQGISNTDEIQDFHRELKEAIRNKTIYKLFDSMIASNLDIWNIKDNIPCFEYLFNNDIADTRRKPSQEPIDLGYKRYKIIEDK